MKASKKNAMTDKNGIRDFAAKLVVLGFGFITLLFIAKKLFGDEFGLTVKWWLVLLAAGLSAMPMTMLVLRRFRDSGWLFAKVIGVACGGWLMWFLSSVKVMKFSETCCWISLFVFFVGNAGVYLLYIRKHRQNGDFIIFEDYQGTITHIVLTELLFLTAFVIWNYIKAFKPEAYGTTEKMMDYGFMKAMYKSDYMPPEDMWMSGEVINYYYVGQFMATFLSKLSGAGVEYGYNFSLNMLAAFGFVLPCSIVYNAASDFKPIKETVKDRAFPYISGGIAGLSVSIAGNLHYNIFNNVVPAVRSILGLDKLADDAGHSFSGYWFPNATRYIGYQPETNDKTIHEFPSYSFVLGDLHAHVLNIMFVLTVIAVLYGLLQIKRKELELALTGEYQKNDSQKGILGFSFKDIFAPSIILIGFFIGLFHTTNYWDFPIYFVVSGAVILFMNCRLYNFSINTLKITLFHAIVVLVTAKLTALPFTLNFTQIANRLNISENHTPMYQLAILWGLPIVITFVFLGILIAEKKGWAVKGERKITDPGRKNALFRFIANLKPSDLFVLTIGLCAFGLVLIPELIYVKDIYSGDYKRANTMFKLSYQAFIMFGMVMSYVTVRSVLYAKKGGLRAFGIIGVFLLVKTFGYFDNASKAWFGDYSFITKDGAISKEVDFVLTIIYYLLFIVFIIAVFRLLENINKTYLGRMTAVIVPIFIMVVVMILFDSFLIKGSGYKSLNSGIYLQDENMDDYLATEWINEYIEGRPVLLEANGNSYTYFNRVSTITGLPTILGWRTHEWLWRSTSKDESTPKIVEDRERDVETIYTSDDPALVSTLLTEYDVKYIYIGGCEREKFEERLNIPVLLSMGTVCYPEDFDPMDTSGTFIIEVGK